MLELARRVSHWCCRERDVGFWLLVAHDEREELPMMEMVADDGDGCQRGRVVVCVFFYVLFHVILYVSPLILL